jgi:FixJ family two-component response regulator
MDVHTMRALQPIVFIVDDDAPTLKELEAVLQSVRLRTESYPSADDFLRNYRRAHPGCLILGDCLTGAGGIEAYRRLRQDGHALPVILLTGQGTVPTAVCALREGAFDYLEKPYDHQYLIERVQAAIAQDRQNRRQEARQKQIERLFLALSPRERAVLNQLMDGQTSRAIARTLGIKPRTVNVHRANIMKKLGVATPADLIYLVFQSGHSRARPVGKR